MGSCPGIRAIFGMFNILRTRSTNLERRLRRSHLLNDDANGWNTKRKNGMKSIICLSMSLVLSTYSHLCLGRTTLMTNIYKSSCIGHIRTRTCLKTSSTRKKKVWPCSSCLEKNVCYCLYTRIMRHSQTQSQTSPLRSRRTTSI